MPTSTGKGHWQGTLREGRGTIALGTGAYEGPYTFASRFETGSGTNPEELLAAAHAGCFSMALSGQLTKAGHAPASIETVAHVTVEQTDAGFRITKSHLVCQARVPGIDEAAFRQAADNAKTGCPVSQALGGVAITLDATLLD